MTWLMRSILNGDYDYLRMLLTGGEPEIQFYLLSQYQKHGKLYLLKMEIDKMRHKEPEMVKKYKEIVRQGMPHCCHTCEHYSDDGVCLKYDMEPPEDFAQNHKACPDWSQEIPF